MDIFWVQFDLIRRLVVECSVRLVKHCHNQAHTVGCSGYDPSMRSCTIPRSLALLAASIVFVVIVLKSISAATQKNAIDKVLSHSSLSATSFDTRSAFSCNARVDRMASFQAQVKRPMLSSRLCSRSRLTS